uniref:Uncharacterized protein n=1 Tax=Arundo donax TaxID=35708 RepID=A0A0A8YQ55_ARUDO
MHCFQSENNTCNYLPLTYTSIVQKDSSTSF